MHKRPLDNPPYQGPGAYQGGSADIKRSRPEMGAGGGSGGGGNNLSIYGESQNWFIYCRRILHYPLCVDLKAKAVKAQRVSQE